MVVDDICEVIGRPAVRFEQHRVVDYIILKSDGTVYNVFESRRAGRYLVKQREKTVS